MRTINIIDTKYFTLDGIRYARIFHPLKQGLNSIAIYNIFDTRQQIVSSTRYDEFEIEGIIYTNQTDAISAILYAVWYRAIEGGGGAGSDTTAIHKDTANEISTITEKTTLSDNDLVIIEDSENGFVKKKAKKSSLDGGGGGDITRNYINPTVNVTIQDSGTAESGTATTLTDNDKSWTADEWIGFYVSITAGTGNGQIKIITDNDATSLTANFDIAPDNTSVYSIIPSILTLNFATKNEVFATKSGGGAIVIDKDITIGYSNETNFKSAWLAIEVKTATRVITFPASHKSGDYRFDTLTLTLGVGFYQISLINNGSYVSILCSESEV